jgi:hypothetical protein
MAEELSQRVSDDNNSWNTPERSLSTTVLDVDQSSPLAHWADPCSDTSMTTLQPLSEKEFVQCMHDAVSLPVFVPLLQRIFLCGLEDAGILLTDWKPVMVVLSTSNFLHVFEDTSSTSSTVSPTNHDLVQSFATIVQSTTTLFFEQDLSLNNNSVVNGSNQYNKGEKPPTSVGASSTPPKGVGDQSNSMVKPVSIINSDLSRLLDSISLSDLDDKSSEELHR